MAQPYSRGYGDGKILKSKSSYRVCNTKARETVMKNMESKKIQTNIACGF